jgi:hypothetical protein
LSSTTNVQPSDLSRRSSLFSFEGMGKEAMRNYLLAFGGVFFTVLSASTSISIVLKNYGLYEDVSRPVLALLCFVWMLLAALCFGSLTTAQQRKE